MTPAEFKERMAQWSGLSDPDIAHHEADKLLLECLRSLGYGEGCDIYEQIEKWYA
jgi:hypothetical protein